MAKGPKCDGKYQTPATGLKRKHRGNAGEHHVPSIIATYTERPSKPQLGQTDKALWGSWCWDCQSFYFLCRELHVPVEATCHQMKPHTWNRRMHMCVHMQMFSIKLCMHPLKTPRPLNTGEGDYQGEEMRGLKVSGVLLSLVSSLWCELQDLLSHWGHWAQTACKETHSEHEAQNSVCSLSSQTVLKSFLCCYSITCRSEPRH